MTLTSRSRRRAASPQALLKRFSPRKAATTPVTGDCAEITFDVEFSHRCPGECLFCGVTADGGHRGIGFSINTRTGEVVDVLNDQGIIGYINSTPIPVDRRIPLHLEIDKFGPNHICTIEIGNERVLYPAVQLPGVKKLAALVGSTPSKNPSVRFGRARLRASER